MTALENMRAVALHSPCLLAGECVNPRYRHTSTTGRFSAVLTVDAGYE